MRPSPGFASSRPAPATRQCAIERLEDRWLMAGQVTAAMNGNTLVITGDDHSNGIEITRIDNNTLRVTGVTQTHATRLNGKLNGTAVFDLKGDVIVRLGGGAEDRLTIRGNSVPQPVGFTHRLLVYGGAGRDVISLRYVSIASGAVFDLGSGHDALTANYTYVGGHLRIIGAATGIGAGNNKRINLVEHNYVKYNTYLTLGSGHDYVNLHSYRTLRMDASLGGGSDYLGLYSCHVVGGTWNGGDGTDTLRIRNSDLIPYPTLQSFENWV